MKPLCPNLRYVLPQIKKAPRILLFLDYDGTLTPIADRPQQALLSPAARRILRELSRDKRIILSIVSGRPLRQIKRLVGLNNIYYAGNHGLEIGLDRQGLVIPGARRSLPVIKRLKKALSAGLKPVRSLKIEDKGIILAVHYRKVKKNLIAHFEETFFKTAGPYLKSGKIKIARGKKVLEIRPNVEWDKGRYCLYLLSRLTGGRKDLLPVYIGDDVTDEDAFGALRRKGITIFVKGEKKTSCAQYYLNSSSEVADFLIILKDRDTSHFSR